MDNEWMIQRLPTEVTPHSLADIASRTARCDTGGIDLSGLDLTMYWDFQLPSPNPHNEPSGCYVWYENLHRENQVVYVGESANLWTRLNQHRMDRYGYSPVSRFINRRLEEPFRPCRWSGIKCDCLPRYFVLVMEINRYSDTDRWDLERELILRLRPIQNRAPHSITEIRKEKSK